MCFENIAGRGGGICRSFSKKTQIKAFSMKIHKKSRGGVWGGSLVPPVIDTTGLRFLFRLSSGL